MTFSITSNEHRPNRWTVSVTVGGLCYDRTAEDIVGHHAISSYVWKVFAALRCEHPTAAIEINGLLIEN